MARSCVGGSGRSSPSPTLRRWWCWLAGGRPPLVPLPAIGDSSYYGSIYPAVIVDPLTVREREIARLAARGDPSQQIADRLFLSVRTVNNHLQSAYAKLGVSGRKHLAGALDETGADPPDAH